MDRSIFRDTANYRLAGSTFDAHHFGKLVKSNFNSKHHVKTNVDYFNSSGPFLQSECRNTSNFKDISVVNDKNHHRPSPSFLTLQRDLQKQDYYID